MSYHEVMNNHHEDLSNLSTLLRNYVEIYRLLISSTAELNATSVSRKGELKHAVERIDSIGDIIDDLLKAIKKCENSYAKFCTYKDDIISERMEKSKIYTEVDSDLMYYNEN